MLVTSPEAHRNFTQICQVQTDNFIYEKLSLERHKAIYDVKQMTTLKAKKHSSSLSKRTLKPAYNILVKTKSHIS